MIGVLDRMEEGFAVILVAEKNDQFTVRKQELPAGSKEGTAFRLKHDDSSYIIIGIDEAETRKRKESSASLMEQLQQRKKQSKFRRK